MAHSFAVQIYVAGWQPYQCDWLHCEEPYLSLRVWRRSLASAYQMLSLGFCDDQVAGVTTLFGSGCEKYIK